MGSHRAEHRIRHRPEAGSTPVPGRRRAEKPERVKRSLRRSSRLPSVPTLLGVAALVAAGAGAVTVDNEQVTPSAIQLSSQGPTTSGTDAIGFVGDPRERAISRDSERQALEDAADAQLE